MPAAARATLESLLRTRKLDSTLTTALPLTRHEDDVIPTGVAGLDAQLFGGFPRGQVSEIVGPRSSGRTSLAQSAVAGLTRHGELAALVDTLDRWDPAGLAEEGADLDRLLWVRGTAVASGFGAASAGSISRVLDRAIKAVTLVLHAGGFALVVLDVADVPLRALRDLPFTTWRRLHRVVEGGSTACVIVGGEPLGRSAGGVTIRLEPSGRASGASPRQVIPCVGEPRIDSFHAEVRASRRPFIRHRPVQTSAARWAGEQPARRLRGLSIEASIGRAHQALQTIGTVPVTFGD
jgi:hypothetical protein